MSSFGPSYHNDPLNAYRGIRRTVSDGNGGVHHRDGDPEELSYMHIWIIFNIVRFIFCVILGFAIAHLPILWGVLCFIAGISFSKGIDEHLALEKTFG